MAEVKALPWYEQEMLLDGLRAEFPNSEQEDGQAATVPMSLDQLGIQPIQMQ